MSKDKLSTRLAQILMRLNNAESLSLQELADEFGVDKRTIQRDINERLSFMPIKRQNGRYALESFALGKLSFKDIQNFANLSGVRELYPKLDAGFISDLLSTKFSSVLMIRGLGYEIVDYKDFELISEAILNEKILSFEYKGILRHIKPYKLVSNNGIWYVLADENDKLKNFTLSKISNLRLRTEKFTPKSEFKNLIAGDKSLWFGELQEVVLRVDLKAWDYFMRKPILANLKLIEENEHFFVVQTKISYDDEILNLVKQWIPYIKILSPKRLQIKLEKLLKEYLKKD